MPETEPTPWELMRILRDIREDLRDIKRNSITRDEWGLEKEASDRRFGELAARQIEWRNASTEEHKELHARIDAVVKDVKEVRKERDTDEKSKQKDASTRRFSLALAGFAAALSLLTGLIQFVVNGGA